MSRIVWWLPFSFCHNNYLFLQEFFQGKFVFQPVEKEIAFPVYWIIYAVGNKMHHTPHEETVPIATVEKEKVYTPQGNQQLIGVKHTVQFFHL